MTINLSSKRCLLDNCIIILAQNSDILKNNNKKINLSITGCCK